MSPAELSCAQCYHSLPEGSGRRPIAECGDHQAKAESWGQGRNLEGGGRSQGPGRASLPAKAFLPSA